MTRRSRFTVSLVLGVLALVLPFFSPGQPALATGSGTTRWVSKTGTLQTSGPGSDCQHPRYRKIQDAVTASSPGDTIKVCPGTYPEQVNVPGGKDGLTLRSVEVQNATIKAPTTPSNPPALVRINVSKNVTILAFTITGQGTCASIQYGVLVDNATQANISGNHITQIRDPASCAGSPPNPNNLDGRAVQVGLATNGGASSAKISGNLLDKYGKNGVTISHAGSNGDIVHNRILGVGKTLDTVQNGVQVSTGTTAYVNDNVITNHLFNGTASAATGILADNSGRVTTTNNTVSTNDVGVYLNHPDSGSQTLRNNRARGSSFDGIALNPASGNSVLNNDVDQNAGPGIGVYNSTDNTIADNDAERNKDSGIVLKNGDTNTVRHNHVRSNGKSTGDTTDGIRAEASEPTVAMPTGDPSENNTIDANFLRDNKMHDCHDASTGPKTAGTANTWTNNNGVTSNRPGLCTYSSDYNQNSVDNQNDLAQSQQVATSAGWDPSFAWYASDPDASEYDWSTVYATVDSEIQALLQVVPLPRLLGNGPPPSPGG